MDSEGWRLSEEGGHGRSRKELRGGRGEEAEAGQDRRDEHERDAAEGNNGAGHHDQVGDRGSHGQLEERIGSANIARLAHATQGFVVPYSPKYADLGTNVNLLQQLVAAGGGRDLTDTVQAFAHDLQSAGGLVPIWPYLAAAALLLFLLDVASRRFRVAPSDVALLWQMLARRLPARPRVVHSRRQRVSVLRPVSNFGDAVGLSDVRQIYVGGLASVVNLDRHIQSRSRARKCSVIAG